MQQPQAPYRTRVFRWFLDSCMCWLVSLVALPLAAHAQVSTESPDQDQLRALSYQVAQLQPASQGCPAVLPTYQKGCRLRDILAGNDANRLRSNAAALLETETAQYLIGVFFIDRISRCIFSAISQSAATDEVAARLAPLASEDVYKLAVQSPAFLAYREELKDRLVLDGPVTALDLALEVNNRPGGKRLIVAYLANALRFERTDCRVLSANERQVIPQIISQISR